MGAPSTYTTRWQHLPLHETPETRNQVEMTSGVLEVHDNVRFAANTAGYNGGAVSLPFDTVALLPVVVLRDWFCEGWFHL